MIRPTIGRVVWYWAAATVRNVEGAQPNPALVTWVWGDGELVNLVTFDCNGDARPAARVPLWQGEGEPPTDGQFAEWMPYQKQQAAKQEVTAPTNVGAGLEFGEFKDRIAAIEFELKSIRQVADYIKQLPNQAAAVAVADGVFSGEKHIVQAPPQPAAPPSPPAPLSNLLGRNPDRVG